MEIIVGIITTFNEVQVGDCVRDNLGGELRTVLVVMRSHKIVHLKLQLRGFTPLWCQGAPDRPIILVQRPRPEGKTEKDMLNEVIVAMVRTATTSNRDDFREQLEPLRETMDAYKLSKSFDEAQGKPLVEQPE